MLRRCGRHQWVDDSRHHIKGALDKMTNANQKGASDQMMERLLYGVTTVTQRCSGCDKLSSYIVTGDAR